MGPVRKPRLTTVIVPVRNEEAHLADQLEALAALQYDGAWELLIVDNGSTDRSVAIARAFSERLPLRIVDASDRSGLNHARNVGARSAAGDFLAFCDADDVVSPGWLAALTSAADGADIVAGALESTTLNQALHLQWQPSRAWTDLPVAHGFLPYAAGGNCGVWTEVARAIGWDESFRFGSSDIEFSWRAQLAGRRIVFAPEAIVHRRACHTLSELAGRNFAYGKSGPHLERAFVDFGMPRLDRKETWARWRWLARRAPDVVWPPGRRGNWIRVAALSLGQVFGHIWWRLRRWSPGRAHLLEVGLTWPPPTFIQWKLEGLAVRGFRVTLASRSRQVDAQTRLRGVRLVRLAHWEEPRPVRMLGALWDGFALALVDRARFAQLVRVLWRETGSRGLRRLATTAGGLRDYARLARLRPDVVHAEWESAAAFHLPLLDVWRCPFVVSCHGAGVNVFPSSIPNSRAVTALREVFRCASVVHCVSDAVIAEAQLHGLDPAKASVIRPAVDPVFFCPDGPGRTDPDELRIVSVGALIWVKGYEYGVEALGLLVRRGIRARLDIVGPEPHDEQGYPSDRERIEHAIADLGLQEHVRLHGRVPSSEVRRLLREADVLLHSSLSEGIPTATVEAMACGVPVVTTECGGVREAVRDGVDGFVVPLRDARALAAALGKLAESPELRRRMGASGRARVCEAFTLDAQLDAYVALYDRALLPRPECG